MPHLSRPNVIASMKEAVSDGAKALSFIQNLGPRPYKEFIDKARSKLAEIESGLAASLEVLFLCPRPGEAYAKLLKEAEERLVKIYEDVAENSDEANAELARILQ
ncbi:hypothetical protein F3Y22_tig00110799pilonHSYRG00023 [Hibiscus syriacus]|uniref:Uncharacterized protein n=1 Tax=Hibiscus syriacus TaxID=106335 RepID=A0A6A2ZPE8_HIBSY|nr:hypothetical protein F3Y22_tig00110799pilonHSYRG00023 [Hibiscus syriacus]